MALKATVFRLALDVADMAREHYGHYDLTLARHPSETDARMLLRVLAFALHAHADLQFTRGLSSDDEPDLWHKDPTGEVLLWLELGQPDPRRLRRACGVARRVMVYSYGERAGRQWWSRHGGELGRLANLGVAHLEPAAGTRLEDLVARSMALTVTIAEEALWLTDGAHTLEVERRVWQAPP